ncbi:MAG: winged helix-turn-helix domain-containing protein [Planctomycetota bacterium]|nr:winged helix-turn-helix domain-containing protein [Planctomycetota bacterium]
MEQIIGEHAGQVWELLNEKGEQSTSNIAKALKLKAADVDRALGWLAREGKLAFNGGGKGAVKVGLK